MAYYWNAYTPTKLKILIKKKMVSMKTKLKLLYITPEQYLTAHFQVSRYIEIWNRNLSDLF